MDSHSHPNASTRFKVSHSKLVDFPLINIDLIHLPSFRQSQNSVDVGFNFLVTVNTILCSLYSRHTVLSLLHELTCLLLISTMEGKYNHYRHCADERTGQERVSNLPKITQLVRARPGIWTQEVWLQSLGSLPLITYTFKQGIHIPRLIVESDFSLLPTSRNLRHWFQVGMSCTD